MLTKRNSVVVGLVLCVVALVGWIGSKNNDTGMAKLNENIVSRRSVAQDTFASRCTTLCDNYANSASATYLLPACKADCANTPEPADMPSCISTCDRLCLNAVHDKNKNDCQFDCKDGCQKDLGSTTAMKAQECAQKLKSSSETVRLLKRDYSSWMDDFPIADDAMFVSGKEVHGKVGVAKDASENKRVRSEMGRMCSAMTEKHTSYVIGKNLDELWLLFGDNTVVSADLNTCKIDGVFLADSDGSMNQIALSKFHARQDEAKKALSSRGDEGVYLSFIPSRRRLMDPSSCPSA